MKSTGFAPEELVILDKSPLSPTYAETFAYAPSENEERLGQLYIACEIFSNKSKKENAELVSRLAGGLKNEYYKNTMVTPISALRFALKRANMFLASKKNWLTPAAGLKPKIAVAALKDSNLHLAKMGEAAALILRDDNLQSIMAPAPRLAAAPNAPTPSWSFENIVSGELLESDTVVLATNQIHKIDEDELIYKLKKKELAKYLKSSGEGIKNLALIALYPKGGKGDVKGEMPLSSPLMEKRGEKGERGKRRKWLKPVIFLLAAAVAAAAVGGVGLRIKKETAQNKKEAEALVREVGELKEKIAGLMEVKNETEAGELLASAAQKLKRLKELGLFKTTRATLEQELAGTTRSLTKLEEITALSQVLTLENNSAGFAPRRLALGRNKVFLFGGGTFYRFDLNRQTGSFYSADENALIKAVMEKPDDPGVTFAATQDKIIRYSNSPEAGNIWVRTENQPLLEQAALYRDAFYLLAEDGFIYKLPYEVSSTTADIVVGEFQLWTNQSQTTNYKLLTTSLAVAGSIFGLTDEHTVAELLNGQKQKEVSAAESLSEVFTLANHKSVYALAPKDGLIVVWDKDFNLKRRLGHPELKGALSFTVNSQERMIYFLKGQTVYSFEI